MKVAHFVPIIASKPGFEGNVSGHVQVPMHSLRLLRDAGHDVHLITNPLTDDRPVWPHVLPDGIGMHFVDDGRRRSPVVDGVTEPTHGIHPGRLLRQMGQIKRIAREQQFDVMHFFGFARTAHLAVILRRGGLRTPMVMTLFNGDRSRNILSHIGRRAWTRVMPMVTATQYVASMCADQGVETTVIRHGPVRDLRSELNGQVVEPADRVLFWRDASFENGADLCIRAYDALAEKHPDVQMEFAVRPHWSEVEGLGALAARHPNVHIHRFPYPPGITLPGLVLGSLCVVMPFREQSVQPQLVIVESMAGGVPVVASDLCSTNELVEHGRTGMLVPVGDAEATTAALDEMLRDRAATREMGRRAAVAVADHWNWNDYVDQIAHVYERAGEARGRERAVRLPDFLIIGAQKAGTTTLWRDLLTQPGVFMPREKEPHCLVDDAVLAEPGRSAYARLFAPAAPEQVCGEASTAYTKLPDRPGVPAQARKLLGPDLRAIYVVRNPVTRIISHHLHDHLQGLVGPDIDEAVRTHPPLLDYTRYAMQARPWIETFGAGQVRIVRFEDYVADRRGTVEALDRFLGVESRPELVEVEKIWNRGADKPITRGPFGRVPDLPLYRRLLRPLLPLAARDRLRRLLLPKPPPERPAPPGPATVDLIIDALTDDLDELPRLAGASAPLWDLAETRARFAAEAAARPAG